MTEHKLPEPRQTLVYDVWGVFKHYDAMAPETDILVKCATEDLAKEVADFLRDHEDDNPIVFKNKEYYFGKPYTQGFEHCSSYRTCKTTEEDKNRVALSLGGALLLLEQ